MESMRVGVLGSGQVGRALAAGFTGRGHDVRIGARSAGPDVAPFAEVAAHGELIVLALRGDATIDVVTAIAPALAGKVVLDATNPLGFGPDGPALFVSGTDSLGERVQRAAPAARVVKALNIVNNSDMVDPAFDGGPPDMFVAGDDPAAKATVTAVLESFGWPRTFDVGGIAAARELESLCLLWVRVGQVRGDFGHAFAVRTHPA